MTGKEVLKFISRFLFLMSAVWEQKCICALLNINTYIRLVLWPWRFCVKKICILWLLYITQTELIYMLCIIYSAHHTIFAYFCQHGRSHLHSVRIVPINKCWRRRVPFRHEVMQSREAWTRSNSLAFLIFLHANKSIVLHTSARKWTTPDWRGKWSSVWQKRFSNGLFHLS